MKKRYSQKWQRYFIKLLVNEPFFNEPEDKPRTKAARAHIAAAISMATMFEYLKY